MTVTRHIFLVWILCLGFGAIAQKTPIVSSNTQKYTDAEIGFDAERLTQRLLERNIPEAEINFYIQSERELYIEQYQYMQSEMRQLEQEQLIFQKTVQTQNFAATSNAATPCTISEIEKQALIALYNATDGPSWTNSWDIQNTEPCDWYGVTVIAGVVAWLNLENNGLVGTIPEEIGNLAGLEILRLSNCQLSGTIPSSIGNLSNLEYLGLSSNQLTGEIPTVLSNCSNLERISLSNNELTGSIPASLGQLNNL
ncbi:MAG: hypothetical protein AAGF77_07780, partial [Bacteroidota bacterium]